MSRIFACINIYNDAWTLERCVKSLRQGVRDVVIVVVDGAYATFPHSTSPCSTDGTIQLAKHLADVIVENKEAWPNEETKRSRYLIGRPGDTYLVIDADEELIGAFPGLVGNDGDITITSDNKAHTPFWLYRVFKHREGIKYFGTHHSVWVGAELMNKWPHEEVKGCHLLHHQLGRRDHMEKIYKHEGMMLNRIEAKGVYYREMADREKPFRDKYKP